MLDEFIGHVKYPGLVTTCGYREPISWPFLANSLSKILAFQNWPFKAMMENSVPVREESRKSYRQIGGQSAKQPHGFCKLENSWNDIPRWGFSTDGEMAVPLHCVRCP